MNCVQRSEDPGVEPSGGVEKRLVDLQEIHALQQMARTGDGRPAEMTDGARHFGASESAGNPGGAAPQEAPKRHGLGLADDELHEGGRIEVNDLLAAARGQGHRSAARAAAKRLDAVAFPLGGLTGAPRASRSPVPLTRRPSAASRAHRSSRTRGTRRATARPRSVISTRSPRATRRITALAFLWSSRMPTRLMCGNVAQSSTWFNDPLTRSGSIVIVRGIA